MLRLKSSFWVGFGPVKGDPLGAEGFKMVENRLEEGKFGWVFREWRG